MNKYFNRISHRVLVVCMSVSLFFCAYTAENCRWLSWHPDFEGSIRSTFYPRYSLVYRMLWFSDCAWYHFNENDFIRLLCLGDPKAREAFKLKFLTQDENGTFSEEEDGVLRFLESDVDNSALQEKFVKAVRDRVTSRIYVYRMFLVNEICRKIWEEKENCPQCLQVASEVNKNPNFPVKSRDLQARNCVFHSNEMLLAEGLFVPVDFSLEKNNEDRPPLHLNPILDRWLQMFVGDENEPFSNLLSKVKKVQTDYGHVFSDYMFRTPSSSEQILAERQALIKRFIQDDHLYYKVRSILAEVAKIQREINSFIVDKHAFLTDTSLFLYPQGMKALNDLEIIAELGSKISLLRLLSVPVRRILENLYRNEIAILAGSIVKPMTRLFLITVPLIAVFGGDHGLLKFILNQESDKGWFSRVIHGMEHYAGFQSKALANQYMIGDDMIEDESHPSNKTPSNKNKNKIKSLLKFLYVVTLGIEGLILASRKCRILAAVSQPVNTCLFFTNNVCDFSANFVRKTPAEFSKVKRFSIALSKMVSACKELYDIFTNFVPESSALSLLGDLDSFVNTKNKTLKGVLDKLASINSGSSSPSILSAARRAYEVRWLFTRPLEAIGQIDAFVGAATLFRQHQHNKGNKFCFVDFRKSPTPGFVLQNFWNPYIEAKNAVPNSLSLGLDQDAKHMLLCGPNAGGKSTILRAVSICLLMGQTWGIAPAEKCIFSIYDQFDSCMSTKDDPANKRSLFMVQSDSVNKIRKFIGDAEKKGKFSFVAIDEIYGGTGAQSAVPLGLAFGIEISKHFGCTVLLSSHFWDMCKLESMTNGRFKNFKVVKEEGDDGKIKMTYKLAEGAPDKWNDSVGIEVAEQCGTDKEFIRCAQEIKQEIYAAG